MILKEQQSDSWSSPSVIDDPSLRFADHAARGASWGQQPAAQHSSFRHNSRVQQQVWQPPVLPIASTSSGESAESSPVDQYPSRPLPNSYLTHPRPHRASFPVDFDDPAFANDPHLHPDNLYSFDNIVKQYSDDGKQTRVKQPFVDPKDLREDSPPPYEESDPYARSSESLQEDASHVDGAEEPQDQLDDENNFDSLSSTHTGGGEFIEGDEQDLQLPYLRNEEDISDSGELQATVPQNSGTSVVQSPPLPVTHALPINVVRRVSEPPRIPLEPPRPSMGWRNVSSPPARAADLDRIDELDESGLGSGFHHRGPYEVNGKIIAPPRPALPFQIAQTPLQNMQIIMPGYHDMGPPPPTRHKLNLQPGQILTRTPSKRAAENTLPRGAMRPTPPGQYNTPLPENVANIRGSGRQLPREPEHIVYYDSQGNPSQSSLVSSPPSSAMPSRNASMSSLSILRAGGDARGSSSDSSAPGSDMDERRPYVPYNSTDRPTFQHASSGSSYAPSTTSSSGSASTMRSRLDGPPRHRPKQLVMPSPLRRTLEPPYVHVHRYSPEPPNPTPSPPIHTHAATIPINPSKRGNLLKKRTTIGGGGGTVHQTQVLAPIPPNTAANNNSRHSIAVVEDVKEKDRRMPRRLSKKRHF